MRSPIHLVDSFDYALGNCFQHQLWKALDDIGHVEHCSIEGLPEAMDYGPRPIISCLKQRTLMQKADWIAANVWDSPIVIYDQDPWQSYMDDSPYKGAYDHIATRLNVKTIALTTKWWADFVASKGHPTTFVKMWVLPEYVVSRTPYAERTEIAGFVGSVHPRRQQLLDIIDRSGIKTSVLRTNSLVYPMFLQEMAKLRIFVHNEDMTYTIDNGVELNFNTGMWVKDIEAAAAGCFSIRGKGDGSETYLQGIETVKLYDHIDQVPDVIHAIEKMDPVERQDTIDRTVELIRVSNVWQETAVTLLAETNDGSEGRI